MKRYTYKKIDNKWYAWDKTNKESLGEGYISKGHAEWFFNKNNSNPNEKLKGRTSLEYYYDNKEIIKEKTAKYRAENKDHLKGTKTRAFKKRTDAYIKVKLELKNRSAKVRAGLSERQCKHCSVSFWAKGKKQYCKRTHTQSSRLAKDLRKRLGKGSSRRIPPWQDKAELKAFLDACPEGLHVDHIIPLRGEIVSGLHCINNLQYLSSEENSFKSNTFDGTVNNDSWLKILKKKS